MKAITPIESTYSNTRSLLEFNLQLQKGTYTVPENMVLVLSVRFQNETTGGNFINIEKFLTVNNFFGHFIESVNIYKKDDLTRIVPSISSGSLGRYMSTILQYMTEEQFEVLERDTLSVC